MINRLMTTSSKSLTLADINYIERSTLKKWIQQGQTNLGEKFQVVDVRDNDHIGGHIINSKHIPAGKFKDASSGQTMSKLLSYLRDTHGTCVVFHCMLSQVRGPSSAMKFMRYCNELLETSQDEQEKEFILNLRITILRGGFAKWQEDYGDDPSLTQGYQKDIWKYGY